MRGNVADQATRVGQALNAGLVIVIAVDGDTVDTGVAFCGDEVASPSVVACLLHGVAARFERLAQPPIERQKAGGE